MRNIVIHSSAALLALSAISCNMFLPKRDMPDEGQLPETFSRYEEPASEARPNRWWETFGQEELNGLVDEALANNLSLAQMWARLEQSRATAVKAGAALYPDLSLQSGFDYNYAVKHVDGPSFKQQALQQIKSTVTNSVSSAISQGANNALTGGTSSSGTSTGGSTGTSTGSSLGSTGTGTSSTQTGKIVTETKNFSLGLAASYEIDLWGRIRSQEQAARFDVEATRLDMESAAMTLAAQVATAWINIQAQQAGNALLAEQLETNRTYLELVELRFRKSQVSALDVYQQRQTVAGIEAQIPLVEAQEEVRRHELAVLLGQPPTTPLEVGRRDLADVPPLPETGLPVQLLSYRPDVRAAYAQLRAADYRVAAAKADRLPAISLTAQAAYNGEKIRDLFDNWFANLAANLSAPIFDGFSRQAEVERTEAVVAEALAAYRQTILTALREVEDALIQESKQRQYLAALERQRDLAQKTLDEARQRYLKGLSDYLPVLAALERTQELSRTLVIAQRDLLVQRITLYRALGGEWTQALEPASETWAGTESSEAQGDS